MCFTKSGVYFALSKALEKLYLALNFGGKGGACSCLCNKKLKRKSCVVKAGGLALIKAALLKRSVALIKAARFAL